MRKDFLIYAVLFKYAHGSMTGPEYHSFQNVFSPIKICMHIKKSHVMYIVQCNYSISPTLT